MTITMNMTDMMITNTCSLSVFQVHDVLLSCMDLKGLMPSGPQTKRPSYIEVQQVLTLEKAQ